MRQTHHRSAKVWHVLSRDHTVLLATRTYIHEQKNHAGLWLRSQSWSSYTDPGGMQGNYCTLVEFHKERTKLEAWCRTIQTVFICDRLLRLRYSDDGWWRLDKRDSKVVRSRQMYNGNVTIVIAGHRECRQSLWVWRWVRPTICRYGVVLGSVIVQNCAEWTDKLPHVTTMTAVTYTHTHSQQVSKEDNLYSTVSNTICLRSNSHQHCHVAQVKYWTGETSNVS